MAEGSNAGHDRDILRPEYFGGTRLTTLCGFYTPFCLCGESHLLICKCCTNLAFLE